MFPDLRQMIAAVLGSILVLICGFGLFAAFRISHEPLARLPATTAMQLAAGDAAKSSKGFVPGQSFDQRFRIGSGSLGPLTAGAPLIVPDRRAADPETTASTALLSAEPDIAWPGGDKIPPQPNEQADLRSSSEKVPEDSTSSHPQPSPPSAAPPETAAGKATEPVPNEAPVVANLPADATATAPTDTAAAILQTTVEAAHQSSESQIPKAPGAATDVSIASLNDQPSDDAQPLLPQITRTDKIETKRKHVRRARRIGTTTAGRDSSQTFATQPNFQPPTTQVVQRPVRIRKIASDGSKMTNTGVGGPFVSPPKP